MFSKLQYISQGSTAKEQIENIQSTLDGGCKWVQLRFKNASENEFAIVAEQVKTMCLLYNAIFIINDHVELAKTIDADGVHLGLKDMNIIQARTILGASKIIGGTANTLEDVLKRIEEKCDYIGLGPFRFTTTKTKLSPVLGLENYHIIMNELAIRNTHIPVYAIGGIMIDDVAALMNTGVHGVAVSGAITNNPDNCQDKKEIIQIFNSLLYEKINNSR